MAKKTDCRVCELRSRCLRHPGVPAQTVAKFEGREQADLQGSFSRKMIMKLESVSGRFIYSLRMGTVEPVFANLCHMLGLDRFTLCATEGLKKSDGRASLKGRRGARASPEATTPRLRALRKTIFLQLR